MSNAKFAKAAKMTGDVANLIDRNGNIVKRFHPTTTPEAIDAEIATLLN